MFTPTLAQPPPLIIESLLTNNSMTEKRESEAQCPSDDATNVKPLKTKSKHPSKASVSPKYRTVYTLPVAKPTTNLGFGDALLYLLEGGKVRRKVWRSYLSIKLRKPDIIFVDEMNLKSEKVFHEISTDELLANDWEIVI